MKDELLTGATEAAKFTGMSRRQIYRLVEDGHLPCARKGRRLFFLKSDLRRAFQSPHYRGARGAEQLTIGHFSARVTVSSGRRFDRYKSNAFASAEAPRGGNIR